MIPSPWAAVVLALAVFRLCRLAGWDHFPLAVKLRARVTGETWHRVGSTAALAGLTNDDPNLAPAWRRSWLHELLSCPFCFGFYVSVAVYILWLWIPTGTLYGAAPFALSAAVGLIAKNLDP